MWIQAAGIGVVTLAHAFAGFVVGAVLLGIGTAMVYPTLLAAIGVYRLWRDLGYAIGALLAGITADTCGLAAAMWLIAGLTFVSGAVSATRMAETLPPGLRTTPRADRESGAPLPGSQRHRAVETHRPE